MTENAKTGIFAGTAAIIGLIAWATMPKQITTLNDDTQKFVGKPIFESFTDPASATSLKIVKYDDSLGQIKLFEVAQDSASGAWVIPSHESYPADAASQISKVANSFIGLKILTVESTKADDQKLFGVVKPDAAKLEVGDTGVGTLVEMKDAKGETLVDLIVGKTVRDDPKKRYVRRARMDVIYSAEFDEKPITTDFSSWIEGDLLKLSSNDIQSISIRDYNILQNANGRSQLSKNFDADLDFEAKDMSWKAKSIMTFVEGKPTERTLAEGEELNAVKINEIKNTLDNLKIVDVARKPKGLAADLKADKELLDDDSKILSLVKKGFMPGPGKDGGMEIYSANGELAIKLNDGVEYLLRFGKPTAGSASGDDAEKDKESVALNCSLFVTARLNENFYPMPELQKVPETIEDLLALEAKEAPKAEASPVEQTSPTTPSPANTKDAKSENAPKPADEPKAEEATKEPKVDSANTGSPKSESKPESEAPKSSSSTKEATTSPSSEVPPALETPKAETPKADVPKEEPAADPKSDQSRNNASKQRVRFVSFLVDEDTKPAQSETPATTEAVKEKAEPTADKAKTTEKKAKAPKKNADASKEKGEADKATAKEPAKKDESEKKEAAKPKSEDSKPAASENKENASGDDKKAAPMEAKKPSADTPEELKERLDAARERITKENTRILDERKDQIEKAKKRAAELNARFAEWYYEITDSEFKRLRASLDDLIKKKGSASNTPPGPPGGMPGFPPGGGLPFQLPEK